MTFGANPNQEDIVLEAESVTIDGESVEQNVQQDIEQAAKGKDVSIESLMAEYETLTEQNKNVAKGITDATQLIDGESIQEQLADAVILLEGDASKGQERSWFSKVPYFGDYLDKAKEKARKEMVKKGSANEGIEKMFNALKSKRDSVRHIVDTLVELRENLLDNLEGLQAQQEKANLVYAVLQDEEERKGLMHDQIKARNLLMDIGSRVIVITSQVENIEHVIQSAQGAVTRMGEIMPSLEINMMTEIAISNSVGQLKDVMSMLSEINKFTKEISATNDNEIQKAVVDTIELVINTGETKQLANLMSQRDKLDAEVKKKTNDMFNQQTNELNAIGNMQSRLDYNPTKA